MNSAADSHRSDTPRTDEYSFLIPEQNHGGEEVVSAETARQLERELAEAKINFDELEKRWLAESAASETRRSEAEVWNEAVEAAALAVEAKAGRGMLVFDAIECANAIRALKRTESATTQVPDPTPVNGRAMGLTQPASLADPSERCVAVPEKFIRFIYGKIPIDGVWFMDRHPKYNGVFWWRTWLRERMLADGNHERPGE